MEVVSWPFWDLGRDWLLEGYLLAVALELRDMFIDTAFQREAMLCAAQKTVFKHSHHRLECSAVACTVCRVRTMVNSLICGASRRISGADYLMLT
jgi:hypothetical protein